MLLDASILRRRNDYMFPILITTPLLYILDNSLYILDTQIFVEYLEKEQRKTDQIFTVR